MPDKAIAIVAASDVKYRSGNVFYKFHQDPDFFYLTGEEEVASHVGVARLTFSLQGSLSLRHWLSSVHSLPFHFKVLQ